MPAAKGSARTPLGPIMKSSHSPGAGDTDASKAKPPLTCLKEAAIPVQGQPDCNPGPGAGRAQARKQGPELTCYNEEAKHGTLLEGRFVGGPGYNTGQGPGGVVESEASNAERRSYVTGINSNSEGINSDHLNLF